MRANFHWKRVGSLFLFKHIKFPVTAHICIYFNLGRIGIMSLLQEYGHPNLERDYNEAIEEDLKVYERR